MRLRRGGWICFWLNLWCHERAHCGPAVALEKAGEEYCRPRGGGGSRLCAFERGAGGTLRWPHTWKRIQQVTTPEEQRLIVQLYGPVFGSDWVDETAEAPALAP